MDKQQTLIILAGGFGTRLQSHDPTKPKPMVLVHSKPFLHWLIQFYYQQGHRHFILSTHHMADQIESYPWSSFFKEAQFDMVRETTPLGTGGAVQEIFQKFKEIESAWVINGDTLLPQQLPKQPQNDWALYCVLNQNEIFDAKPNLISENNKIIGIKDGADYFDAGVVWISRKAIEKSKKMPPCSLHQSLEPVMQSKQVGFCIMPGTCYDIGTPERLKRFEKDLKLLFKND